MIDFNVIKSILSSWLILIMFLQFAFSKKFEYRYNKYLSFILIVFTVTLVYYNLHFSDISFFTELYIMSLLIIILYSIFFKCEFYSNSLICIVFLQFFLISRVWIYIIYNILNTLSNPLFDVEPILSLISTYPYLSRNIIFIFLSLCLYLHTNSKSIRLELIYKNKFLLNTCLIVSLINYHLLLYMFIFINKYIDINVYKGNKELIIILIFLSLISLIFLVLIILLLKIISEKLYIKLASDIVEHQFEIQVNHYKNSEKYLQSSRMIIHDTKHHILALDILLRNNSIDEAKEYISLLEKDLFVSEKNKICENKIVDAILQSTVLDCSNKEIELDYNVNIPDNIEVSHFDLSVIFGNLLNNAIEGCQSINNKDIKKYIEIHSNIINDNLVVKIINSKDHKVIKKTIGLFKTTKLNKLNHGIGLISVKHSLDKYNGNISFHVSDDKFEVDFIVNTKKIKTNF